VCHKWSEQEIKGRVEQMQDNHLQMLLGVEEIVTALHLEIGDLKKLGATDKELESVRKQVSLAQMYWDYVAANNGMGFHAPQECARILNKAFKIASEGRTEAAMLRARKGKIDPVVRPDISTKALAQAFIKPYVTAQAAATKAKEEAEKKAATSAQRGNPVQQIVKR
jgi:nitrite reductase (cytochrome c-552)